MVKNIFDNYTSLKYKSTVISGPSLIGCERTFYLLKLFILLLQSAFDPLLPFSYSLRYFPNASANFFTSEIKHLKNDDIQPLPLFNVDQILSFPLKVLQLMYHSSQMKCSESTISSMMQLYSWKKPKPIQSE